MGRFISIVDAIPENDDDPPTANHQSYWLSLTLDDGSGSTASILTPRYMWEHLSLTKELGQLMECIASSEYPTLENDNHNHNNEVDNGDNHHARRRRVWVAQALMVIVDQAHDAETLRMLQLTLQKTSCPSSTTTSTRTTASSYGLPTLSSTVTANDILHLIQTGSVGDNVNTHRNNHSSTGVSLQDLSLLLDLPESHVYRMVQELQDQGLVYDQNNQQSYVPL
jgi:hypothetical protein